MGWGHARLQQTESFGSETISSVIRNALGMEAGFRCADGGRLDENRCAKHQLAGSLRSDTLRLYMTVELQTLWSAMWSNFLRASTKIGFSNAFLG